MFRFINGDGIKNKKIQKNPNLKKVPTIDEFGGYWKYDNSDAKLLSLWEEEDLNQKIALLDREWERQYGPLPVYKPKINTVKRRKTVDFENLDQNIQSPAFSGSGSGDSDDFAAPSKKIKRERYCSDLTNVTRSTPMGNPIPEFSHTGGFEDESSKEKMEFFFFDNSDNLDNDNSFGFFNSGNFISVT